MTIERTELEDKKEAEDNEEKGLEAKRQEEMETLREEKRQSDLKAAKAEGQAEALKLGLGSTPAQPTWTDEQWEAEGQKFGMDGRTLKSNVMVAKGIADASIKPIKDELEIARREAREAREEAKKIRESKGLDSLQQEFYDKNPALRLHKKEVDDFLSTYPDSDNVNGETLKKRLSIAADVVKGKVKETMRTHKPSEVGSTRLEGTDEELPPGEIGEFDPKGTGNVGGAQLMAQVHANFGKGIKRSDSVDVWKKSLDDEGRGVSISMDEDIERYNKMRDRDSVGGTRA